MTWVKITNPSTVAKYYHTEGEPVIEEENIFEYKGELVDRLGLDKDNLEYKEMYNVLSAFSPDGKEQLFDRSKNVNSDKKEIFGHEFFFAAPKSYSLMALMDGGDSRLKDEFDKKTEIIMERFMDKLSKENNGELLSFSAFHGANRNGDLHIHKHFDIANMVYNKDTNTYKSLQLDYNSAKELQADLSAELIKSSRELGYAVEMKGNNGFWDLKGFDQKVIDATSSRTKEVYDEKEKIPESELTKNTGRYLGLITKADKDTSLTYEDVQERAKIQLSSVGTSIEELKENAKSYIPYQKQFESTKEVLEKTAEHMSANNARFSEDLLLKSANKIAFGEYSHTELKEELDTVKKIGQKEDYELKRLHTDEKDKGIFTTKEMPRIEKNNIEIAQRDIQVKEIMSLEMSKNGIEIFEKDNFTLTQGQYELAKNLLASKEMISMIIGDAGTGKSTTFNTVNSVLSHYELDNQVLILSNTNKAVSGGVTAATVDGKSFDGMTMHKAINQDGLKESFDNNREGTKLILVDEASMNSAKEVNALLKEVERMNNDGKDVKVAFIGDDKQQTPIGAGSPYNQLLEAKGDKVIRLDESKRQRTPEQRDITNAIAGKDIKSTFENLHKAEAIHEIKDEDKRLNKTVDELTKKESVEIENFKGQNEIVHIDYKNTLGLAATNAENKKINEAVRDKLRDEGVITDEVKSNINVGVLKSKEDQSNAYNYQKGMKLTTYEDSTKGMVRGTEYQVVNMDKSNNILKLRTTESDKNGKHKFTTVSTTEISGKVDIKVTEKRTFGIGDKIVITENDKEKGIHNSDQGLIVGMDKKNKIAKVDFCSLGVKELPLKDFQGLDHGFSITNHKSQGMSVDKVVTTFATKDNAHMNHMNAVYVAISRQKAVSVVITDNEKDLMKQASQSAVKVSSLDNLEKGGEIKIENKASSELKNDIKDFQDTKKEYVEDKFSTLDNIEQIKGNDHTTKQIQKNQRIHERNINMDFNQAEVTHTNEQELEIGR